MVTNQALRSRIRGYQYHSSASVKTKKNPAAYKKFTSPSDAVVATKDASMYDGFMIGGLGEGEWPIPDATAEELEKVGFGRADE